MLTFLKKFDPFLTAFIVISYIIRLIIIISGDNPISGNLSFIFYSNIAIVVIGVLHLYFLFKHKEVHGLSTLFALSLVLSWFILFIQK